MWLSAKFGFVGMMKLTDICEFQGGTQPPKNEWSLVEKEGYIRMLQIRDFTQPKKTVPEYIKYHKNIKVCEKDDILIARYGASIGKIVTGLSGAYNVALMRTIPDTSKMLKKYLYYYLNSSYFQNKISNVGSRAAQAGFNQNDLSKLDIICPDLNKQREIIYKLDKIKHVLNNYNKELELLDELVKARFVELFGDENNSRCFDMSTVKNVAEVKVGVVIKPSKYYTDSQNGVKTFRSLNIGDGFIKENEWVYFTEEGNLANSKSILKENDVLVVRSGNPGTSCVVTKKYEGCNAIDVIIARPKLNKVNSLYLSMYTNMPHGKIQIKEGTGGAAQQHFNVAKYNALKLILPPLELQNQFADFVKEVDKSRFIIKSMIKEGLL